MHASERLIDALGYAQGPILCRVELWGDIFRGVDKLVGRHRKVLWTLDATQLLHEFACRYAEDMLKRAEDMLKRAGVTDKRGWAAIEAKRAWLAGKATDEDLAVARSAAWDAICDAAKATRGTTARALGWAAAKATSRGTAWDAAREATWNSTAAWDAHDQVLGELVEAARERQSK
jgi:hypothetical protein